MGTIVVYEDNSSDLIERYGFLTSSHDVHVYFLSTLYPCELYPEVVLPYLKQAGFNLAQVHKELPTSPLEADLFFVDGLSAAPEGINCYAILGQLPRDKAFLTSDGSTTRKVGRTQGFQTIHPGEISQVVERILGS